ncbi:MAG: hypothetical protein AAF358_21065 [Pseudomonadota bacterium]
MIIRATFTTLLLLLPALAFGGSVEVNLSATDPTANELGQESGTIRVTRNTTAGSLTVNVSISGTASVNDFSYSDGGELAVLERVSFFSGQDTVDIVFTAALDNLVEGQEQFDVSLEAGTGYSVGSSTSGSIVIEDDPPVVTLEATDTTADEAGQDVLVFRFGRTGGNVNQNLDVNVNIEPTTTVTLTGAAFDLSGDDGGTLATFQRITIFGGNPSRDLTFTPVLDNRIEPVEQLDLSLDSGSYNIGSQNSASATLADDPPVVTLEAIDNSADEAGQDVMVFRFGRTGGNVNQNLDVSVNIESTTTVTLTGGAFDLSGDDGGTLATFQRITISSGNASRDLTYTPVLDNRIESVEQLDLSIAPGSYNIGAPSSGSATLADDPPTVTLEAIDDIADEAGQDVIVFRFARTGGNINQALTVNVNIEPTTTVSLTGGGFDLSADDGGTLSAFQTVSIPGASASRDVTLTPVLDNRLESDEQLDLSINSGSYVVGTPSSGSALLADDPPVVSVSVVQQQAAEGGPAGIVSVDRTGGNIDLALTINAEISASSTVSNSDFAVDDGGTLQAFGTITLPAGSASRELGFTAALDDLTEGDETLTLDLLLGSYVRGNPASATLLFTDDRLFANGFEQEIVGLKSCSLSDRTRLSSTAFDVVGSQALELSTNLVWLRCSPLQHYDWLGVLCGGQGGSLSPDVAAVLADFNAGLLGDHAGVSSWRLATPLEKAEAGFTGTCFVR